MFFHVKSLSSTAIICEMMAVSDCDVTYLLKSLDVMLERILQRPMRLRKKEEGRTFSFVLRDAGDFASMSSKSGMSASQSSSKIPDGRPPSKQSFLRTFQRHRSDCYGLFQKKKRIAYLSRQ